MQTDNKKCKMKTVIGLIDKIKAQIYWLADGCFRIWIIIIIIIICIVSTVILACACVRLTMKDK